MEELTRIAKILQNKIYNANIFLYEQLARENKAYFDSVLQEDDITILELKQAIEQKKDLNFIHNVDMKKYTNIDLNHFLSKVIIIREQGIEYYIEAIKKDANFYRFDWYNTILECLTYEEGLEIKKACLEKWLNFSISEVMTNATIDKLFSTIVLEFYYQNQSEKEFIR